MAKILCVLYDDPISGYPKSYAREWHSENRPLSWRSIAADAGAYRFQDNERLATCISFLHRHAGTVHPSHKIARLRA